MLLSSKTRIALLAAILSTLVAQGCSDIKPESGERGRAGPTSSGVVGGASGDSEGTGPGAVGTPATSPTTNPR